MNAAPLIKTAVVFLLFFITSSLHSQQQYTLSGHIKDAKSGEDLAGAGIIIKGNQKLGATTNSYGFYSLLLRKGEYTIVASYMGYASQTKLIKLTSDTKMDIKLNTATVELKEVGVTGEKYNDNIKSTQLGVEKIDIQKIAAVPVLFGEKDVMKTIQLLPGIKSSGEGNSGFSVRGGGYDQNLILLDEAPVYNASHLFGFFSIFNSDAIKDVRMYKGGMPVEYGGRLSSALDIKMKDGNNQYYHADIGIGLISSRATVEGPIEKDRGSFMVSARRTYLDLFLKLSSNETLNKVRLYFYDMNVKGNYKFDDDNRIYISGYLGRDVIGLGQEFGIDWGNTTTTVRWNHLFSGRIFSNTSLIFSNYSYNLNISFDGTDASTIKSRIRDYNFKQDFQYFLTPESQLKFGYDVIYHVLSSGMEGSSKNFTNPAISDKHAFDNALYLSHEINISDDLTLNYGTRFSIFSVIGPGSYYTYTADGDVLDTIQCASGHILKTYANFEPRLSLNYSLGESSSIKIGYGRNAQNLHLLSNSTSGRPTDMWILSSNNVKPEISDQGSLGYYRNFKEGEYALSTEIYYKKLQNLIDYKNGAVLNMNENVESQLLFGEGRAYGMELLLEKNYGAFHGWLSYTLSRTERKFPNINSSSYYPAKQDQTHNISVVGVYELSDAWTFSGTWVYNTGNAVTFPSGKYQVAGMVVNYYTERNGYRMPAYHRLDLSATWVTSKSERYESSWTFSLYNAYARDNAYTITFRTSKTDPTKTEAVQTTLFKIIPSITYNLKF